MVYEIRCSWCGILIGTKEKEENEFAVAMKIEGVPVSHSICANCKKAVSKEYGLNQGGKNNG